MGSFLGCCSGQGNVDTEHEVEMRLSQADEIVFEKKAPPQIVIEHDTSIVEE